MSGTLQGHGSVTTVETIETKHNIRRKNFPPIKITYGFVKPPKTSNDPDDAPVRVVLYLKMFAPAPQAVTDTGVAGVRRALASHSLPPCGGGTGRGVRRGDSLDSCRATANG